MKSVAVTGHAFDCLPGHVCVTARGQGSNVRIAVASAVRMMFQDRQLKRKRLKSFKLSVVIQQHEEV